MGYANNVPERHNLPEILEELVLVYETLNNKIGTNMVYQKVGPAFAKSLGKLELYIGQNHPMPTGGHNGNEKKKNVRKLTTTRDTMVRHDPKRHDPGEQPNRDQLDFESPIAE